VKVDFTKYDGRLLLMADRRRGIYASEITLRPGRITNRSAGHLNTSASAHSLLVTALTRGLKSIGNRQVQRITGDQPRKLKLQVAADDPTPCTALRGLMKNDAVTIGQTPFRAGKQFLRMLAKELARFDIRLDYNPEDKSWFQSIRYWSHQHLRPANGLEQIPAYLAPVAVAEFRS